MIFGNANIVIVIQIRRLRKGMVFEKAKNEDTKQLTNLRIAYLKEDLPHYFSKNLNNNIFAYICRNEHGIVPMGLKF